jgi:hypothetical protein
MATAAAPLIWSKYMIGRLVLLGEATDQGMTDSRWWRTQGVTVDVEGGGATVTQR